MVQQRNGSLILSPSDLNAFLTCEHLAALELDAARHEVATPDADDTQGELIRRKGEEHEAAYVAELHAAGRTVATIELGDAAWELERAAADTVAAMRSGVDVVYQAVLLSHDGHWRGFADFLERVETPSELGPWSYEVADTKLARHSKPSHILQLCFYTEQVARLQGREPAQMHVLLGSGERESFSPRDFAAYYRHARERFLAWMAAPPATYPFPVAHCTICDWRERCEAQWVADDHLTLVAGVRREQITRLAETGVTTLAGLARAPDTARPPRMEPATFEKIREQAELQLHHRETGEHVTRLLPPEPKRGFELLPPPSPGDLFFDIEGDPFWEPSRGLEYLFGVSELVDGEPRFRAFWAHSRADEKRVLEEFVDFVHERLRADPNLHVYHYASYEPSVLKRLMGEYGTREDEIDDLLRREVFVDLFKVVRQSFRHSHPKYSLKKVEEFFFEREAELRAGDDSIVLYERWQQERDDSTLEAIRAYNEEDCRSTYELREWLLGLREQAVARFGEIAWKEPKEPSSEPPPQEGTGELRARLLAGLPEDLAGLAGDERVRWLAAQLLEYHRREAKPVWWWFFDRMTKTSDELRERDSESIGGLEPAEPPIGSGQSLVYTFTFPPQLHKLSEGDRVHDPVSGIGGTIDALDDEHGLLRWRRHADYAEEPLPTALIPGGPLQTRQQQAALRRLGESLAVGSDRYPALVSILRRDLPRVRGHKWGAPLPQNDLNEAKRVVRDLDLSHLVVQGPPGSGKTFSGARMIVELMRRRRRVGVTSTSHKAIHNLLDEIEKVAKLEGVRFRGLKKGSKYEGAFITTESEQALFSEPEPDVLLLAGTAWLFSREEMEEAGIDTLVVDEAGQVSLADALAMGTCARNVVLLGDPQQLPHVSQGTHPEGTSRSVLEHLLGDDDTIPPERGLFLGLTWRMHPDVCAFISETSYEGRLHPAPPCERQATSFGTGLRFLLVAHNANRISSPEEAERVRAEIERLLGCTYTDCDGRERRLAYEDVLVVAPYNAHVRCLRAALPERVRVGTVDKFQGQEAAVVFFSMASSSGEDIPRGLGFLFSRNRLNVAISRAKCLAYLVASPRLLDVNCRSVDEMRLVNALCRFVEVAGATRRDPLA